MTPKVLGIAGSPRRGGNTEILLDRALEGAASKGADTEKIALASLKIAPCLNCDRCLLSGECVIRDPMDAMYARLKEADHLIVASPIFFLSVTAQTKTMIDRCQALWAAKYVLHQPISLKKNRRGLFLSAGHWTGPNNFRCAVSVIRAFFVTIDVKYAGDVLIAGVEKKAEILNHPTACRQAFDAGVKLVAESAGEQA